MHDEEERTVRCHDQRAGVSLLRPWGRQRRGRARRPLPPATGKGAGEAEDPRATAAHGRTDPPSLNTFPSSAIDQGVRVKVIELASAEGKPAAEISGTQSCSRSVVITRGPASPTNGDANKEPDSPDRTRSAI